MYFIDKIVQVISSGGNWHYDDYELGQPEVITHDNITSLAQAFQNDLASADVIKMLLKNEHFRTALEAQGWCDLKQAKNVAEKATLGTKFYLWDSATSYSRPHKINFDSLSIYQADTLAKEETILLCEITKGSLSKLNRKVYNAYLKAKKKADERKAKRKQAAEKRAKKKQAKKLAEAKKLLEEAGELK